MRADLDGPVAGVGDAEGDRRAAFVHHDIACGRDDFARRQRFGCATDGLVHSDELCAVRKCGFHLNVVDHVGDAVHHLISGDDMRACFHEFGDGAAIACAFHDEIADERDRFGIVELDAALQTLAGDHCGHGDEELVLLARCEIHGSLRAGMR